MYMFFISAITASVLFFALHITGSSAFPQPLSRKDEEECFKKMSEGDDKAREKIVEHNLRLVAHIIKKYYSKTEEDEDLISIGTIGLIKAVNSYNKSKGVKFATYASRCIENEILMYFRSRKKAQNDVFIDEPIDVDSEGNTLSLLDIISDETEIGAEYEARLENENLYRAINSLPTKRERIIIKLRYGLGEHKPLPQREVASLLGISRSYVSRIEKKTLNKLNRMLSNDKTF